MRRRSLQRPQMLDAFKRGYADVNGPDPAVFLGRVVGMITRTAVQTVVVVVVLRYLGVL